MLINDLTHWLSVCVKSRLWLVWNGHVSQLQLWNVPTSNPFDHYQNPRTTVKAIRNKHVHVLRQNNELIKCDAIRSFPQEKVKAVFDNLIQLEHLNIVKFHKYWTDVKENRVRVGDLFFSPKTFWIPVRSGDCHELYADTQLFTWLFPPQVIFITEYMSSGSLKQFLKKTKKNHKTMNEKVWKCSCNSYISSDC